MGSRDARADAVHHSPTARDAETIAAMRPRMAPLKGALDGPETRLTFDDVMERTPGHPDVAYEERVVGGVPGVWCRPRAARSDVTLLYLHGGAYILGSARAYRHFVGHVAARCGASAFVADYRLAPEHPFPAAVDDAAAVHRALVDGGATRVVVVGDSAGGGITLALLQRTRGGVAPAAAVILSPWVDLALTGDSVLERADGDPFLTKRMLAKAASLYLEGRDAREPEASPLYAALDGLPPVQIHVGTEEVLLDDALRLAERARAASVDATLHVWEGMIHVFPVMVGALDAADEALRAIASFVGMHAAT